MTAVELRHAVAGYPAHVVRAAVEAGLREHPLPEAEGDLDLHELVAFWLLEPDGLERFAPPLSEAKVAAIYRRLREAAS